MLQDRPGALRINRPAPLSLLSISGLSTSGACSREAALHGYATTTPLVALCCLAWILPPCAKPRAADCRSSSISACIVCYTQYNEPPKFFVGLELYQQR